MEKRQLPAEFKEFLSLLNKNDVEYLLVGGWAVGFYGYSRFTADIDIFIGITQKNIDAMMQAMKEFGIPQFDTTMLTTPGHVFRIGRMPLLIEVLNDIDGITFSESYQNKEYVEAAENLTIPIISLKDLIKNKSSTGRTKDKLDLEFLLDIKKSME